MRTAGLSADMQNEEPTLRGHQVQHVCCCFESEQFKICTNTSDVERVHGFSRRYQYTHCAKRILRVVTGLPGMRDLNCKKPLVWRQHLSIIRATLILIYTYTYVYIFAHTPYRHVRGPIHTHMQNTVQNTCTRRHMGSCIRICYKHRTCYKHRPAHTLSLCS